MPLRGAARFCGVVPCGRFSVVGCRSRGLVAQFPAPLQGAIRASRRYLADRVLELRDGAIAEHGAVPVPGLLIRVASKLSGARPRVPFAVIVGRKVDAA
ncbi:hypothetical protein GCM10010260_63940 [Streptomyces filipinensis]|uniref:Uncharacterized protein n=1 Tax=Streptomyces filipinensis TaxID=66887 RepID=A0A918IGK6_9ACTN|nr:hypothetical protein GCM10010260_63940 [Streptomyces filipinensis]